MKFSEIPVQIKIVLAIIISFSYAYLAYVEGGSRYYASKLTSEQTKIVQTLEKTKAPKSEVKWAIINIGQFKGHLEEANKAIEQNNLKLALNEIINANGDLEVLAKFKGIDIRELKVKLLEVRKALAKELEKE
jgi:hypothetical protein